MMLIVALSLFVLDKGALAAANKRSGKFLGLTADDMFNDALDDVQNPFPVVNYMRDKKDFYTVSAEAKSTPIEVNYTGTNETPNFQIAENQSLLQVQQPIETVTDNVIFHHEQDNKKPTESPADKNSTQDVKIFWEAVENIPFLPIHLNVPDMIAAMAAFLSTYFPMINRLTNPNNPRLPYQVSGKNQTNFERINRYRVYDVSEEGLKRRDFLAQLREEDNASRKRRKNKRKGSKKRNSQKANGKRIFQTPQFGQSLKRTTMAPVDDTKFLNGFGADTKETFKLKNMPITRKKIRIADREIFNFKNSDISNSPIMILNVPQRPITQYKFVHTESRERNSRPERISTESSTQKVTAKQKRRLKNEDKTNRSFKKSRTGEMATEKKTNATTTTTTTTAP